MTHTAFLLLQVDTGMPAAAVQQQAHGEAANASFMDMMDDGAHPFGIQDITLICLRRGPSAVHSNPG
jgi:hypothetical protein